MEYENNNLEAEITPCPNCESEEQIVAPVQTVADRVLPALKDGMFLAICILMSASCVISLSMDNVPLIGILATVFLWLTYAQSCKDIADAKHLRCVSGTIYAEYIIAYVAAGLLVLIGVLFTAAFTFLTQNPDLLNRTLSLFTEMDEVTYRILHTFASVSSLFILLIFLFVAGFIVLINMFTTRYIHRFVKSVYKSIETNTLELKRVNAAKICLYILSGFSAVSALSCLGNPLQLLSHGSSCAITLLSALLIKKYFIAE